MGSNNDLNIQFGRLTAEACFAEDHRQTIGVDVP